MAFNNAVDANTSGYQSITSAGVWNGRTFQAGSGITLTNADGTAGNTTITASAPTPGVGVSNLGITYSSGTGLFSVTSANGAALSSTNPGTVTLQSGTPGQLVMISVTANQSFTDHNGSSTITGNTFGASATTWGMDMPFYIYAVANSTFTAISFMIARIPQMSTSPAAGNIGVSGSAVASNQSSMFALDTPTVANFASQPCLLIGSFRMQKPSTTDWVVSALNNRDGIGFFQLGNRFTYPLAVNGCGSTAAGTNSIFFPNGGTAPTTAAYYYYYTISLNGIVLCEIGFNCNATGVGSVALYLTVPFQNVVGAASSLEVGSNFVNDGSAVAGTKQRYNPYMDGTGATFFLTNATNTALLNTGLITGYVIMGQLNYTIYSNGL